ncbi:ribosome biogenesis GTP-binding protein YihA/YsxC [Blattabacterium cuenoti]|uniref:ribosome biogenesis GTP-binding protein YihA/YsxC n=1 Tax=Blattabacterium cuenoti TaxID=1653831 RepID=UPI00163BE129|nr:ribosome biogenesis GTP-binding protein YihA/YsxC [Blattabacterium cuenoti]
MKIISVKFKGSLKNISQFRLLTHNVPEHAFVGRSNVGKSSLINSITKKKIAKVSSYPGRTQSINYFLINHKWYLVDLPGYGFFSVKKLKERTQKLIRNFILNKKNNIFLFLLIDCRFFLQKKDLNFIKKLNNLKIHFCIVFTKMDKLKSFRLFDEKISFFLKEIKKNNIPVPTWFKVSAKKKHGINNLIRYIKKLNDFYFFHIHKQKLIIPNSYDLNPKPKIVPLQTGERKDFFLKDSLE